MKNIRLTVALMLLLGATACNKSVNSPNSNTGPTVSGTMSTDDAAGLVAGSLSSNSNGVAQTVTDATLDAAVIFNAHVKCGTTRSDTISRQSSAGSAYTYSFNLTYNFMVDCNSNSQPDSLSSNLTWSGSFSGPNWSQSGSGSSIFGVGGLLQADTAFMVNGEFKRSGSFASKQDTSKHGNSSIDIVVNNLLLGKHFRKIDGGSATFSLTGSTPKRGSFSFTGTIVFNGDGTATVTVNATVYTVNLSTGGYSRR